MKNISIARIICAIAVGIKIEDYRQGAAVIVSKAIANRILGDNAIAQYLLHGISACHVVSMINIGAVCGEVGAVVRAISIIAEYIGGRLYAAGIDMEIRAAAGERGCSDYAVGTNAVINIYMQPRGIGI